MENLDNSPHRSFSKKHPSINQNCVGRGASPLIELYLWRWTKAVYTKFLLNSFRKLIKYLCEMDFMIRGFFISPPTANERWKHIQKLLHARKCLLLSTSHPPSTPLFRSRYFTRCFDLHRDNMLGKAEMEKFSSNTKVVSAKWREGVLRGQTGQAPGKGFRNLIRGRRYLDDNKIMIRPRTR